MRNAIVYLLIIIIAVGCSPKYDESYSFIAAEINDSFPIPKNAKPIEGTFNNPQIKSGEYYELRKIGGNQGLERPERYIEEIIKWGWTEKERLGDVYFFEKEDFTFALVVKENEFSLYEMK